MVTKKSKVRRRFVVRNSGIHGKGVFATTRIPAGARLIEYKGERLTEAQVDKRYAKDDNPHTFLFALDDGMVIDATTGGNSARWINHSCAPNCEAVDDGDRIYIETLRAIPQAAHFFLALSMVPLHWRAPQRHWYRRFSSGVCRSSSSMR